MTKPAYFGLKLLSSLLTFVVSVITHFPIIEIVGFVYLAWICTARHDWNLRGLSVVGFGLIVSGWSRINLERSMLALAGHPQVPVQFDLRLFAAQSDFRQGAILIFVGSLLMIYADTRPNSKRFELEAKEPEVTDDQAWPPAPKSF